MNRYEVFSYWKSFLLSFLLTLKEIFYSYWNFLKAKFLVEILSFATKVFDNPASNYSITAAAEGSETLIYHIPYFQGGCSAALKCTKIGNYFIIILLILASTLMIYLLLYNRASRIERNYFQWLWFGEPNFLRRTLPDYESFVSLGSLKNYLFPNIFKYCKKELIGRWFFSYQACLSGIFLVFKITWGSTIGMKSSFVDSPVLIYLVSLNDRTPYFLPHALFIPPT